MARGAGLMLPAAFVPIAGIAALAGPQDDIEMMREIGYCHGIENYARHLSGRAPGEPPPTLLDYLPPDALTVVDGRVGQCFIISNRHIGHCPGRDYDQVEGERAVT